MGRYSSLWPCCSCRVFRALPSRGGGDKSVLSQRAVLLEDGNAVQGVQKYGGTVVWRAERTPQKSGTAPELVMRADVEIPERHMHMTWSMRKNTDKSLLTSHIIDIEFLLPADFSEGGVSKLTGAQMRVAQHASPEPLAGLFRKVSDSHFQMVVSEDDYHARRNFNLLRKHGRFEVSIVHTSGKRAILTMEKE